MPKISVLIPIYNVSTYLSECLESVIHQSEHDLEIICVEDASTDISLEILEKYANQDSRIKIIKHTENKGLCQTRKDAVAIAQGEYIMFVDSDDYLSLDACENLYREIVQRNVDILQFGTELIANENVSKDMIEWTTAFMKPSLEQIENGNLLRESIINHKFNCNLCNKIWRSDCCKKAYCEIIDGYYVSAEDRYATFIITYFSRSYAGIENQYYHYRIGVGVTGSTILDLHRFENRCSGAKIVQNIQKFLISKNALTDFKEEFYVFKKDILLDCIDCWKNKLESCNQELGYKLLLQYWGAKAVVSMIGERYFEDQRNILSCCNGADIYNTVIYYRYIGYAPMDAVLQHYIEFTASVGEKIYLVTDQDAPEKGSLYLNLPIHHIYPATDANWDKYRLRCNDLIEFLEINKINKLIYLSPTSQVTMLDGLAARSIGVDVLFCMDEYAVDIQNKLAQENSKCKIGNRIIRFFLHKIHFSVNFFKNITGKNHKFTNHIKK